MGDDDDWWNEGDGEQGQSVSKVLSDAKIRTVNNEICHLCEKEIKRLDATVVVAGKSVHRECKPLVASEGKKVDCDEINREICNICNKTIEKKDVSETLILLGKAVHQTCFRSARYCFECGFKNEEKSVFCGNCGIKIT